MNAPNQFVRLLASPNRVSIGEQVLAALGCFMAILVVAWSSRQFTDGHALTLMIASMGASSILVFAVPHSPFSLPWPVIGGQMVSAVVGVTAVLWVPDPVLGLAVAVGGAALAMHLLHCLHPPGGATAAAAVLGGGNVAELGYHFVWTPVGFNALILVLMGLVLHNARGRLDYPAGLGTWLRAKPASSEASADVGQPSLGPADLESALNQMNMFIDVDRDDLARLYELAREHAAGSGMPAHDIRLGRYYSNGKYGTDWCVRQVVDEPSDHGLTDTPDRVVYRVVAGRGRGRRGECTRETFAHWARYEVCRNENCWHRVPAAATVQQARA